MSRTLSGLFVCVVAGLSGCASPAKVIRQDPTSVVVAIPDNTNIWPFYYQDEAKQTAGMYIQDPVLVSSQRVKVGEQTTNTSDTTRRDTGSPDKQRSFTEVMTSSNVTSISDRYEFQLEFRSASPTRVTTNPPSNNSAPPTPGGPAATLAPQGPPLSTDVAKPASIPPILPLTPPASPATSLPSAALPGPGR
ncbi:MAG TPA: hypothetical protein VHR66_16960 [Gemmataceae bacterium]|jgi:hypothetical protein|nr:hypothetical protein [Gemmataceae bacterium]